MEFTHVTTATKELIATQFESHHAREVFPCIDEPEAKATFDVTITSEQGVTVLGNMPIKNQIVEDDKLVTSFETTPKMSTYLLAWVIGELQCKSAKTKSGVTVNAWTTLAQSPESLDFALDIATRSIDFFDDLYDTPYPLQKCDNVALPDFSAGAMENWGLITYREVAMLADPKKTSISTKQNIASTIAHELSHQWFGNLVTMKWWNDLWLNESFASLVTYDAIDALEPSWNTWLDFDSYESVVSLRRDSLAGVQSVQTEVNHPDEIGTLFDGAIVYAKGAKLLKMLRRYIGQDSFRTGLKKYFETFAYKNTIGNDLWSILSEVSKKDVSGFMNLWISRPGFPVLHVKKDKDKIIISQNRLENKIETETKDDTLWPIPLNSNLPDSPEIFDHEYLELTPGDVSAIRFNIGNDGHYVTHYDHGLLQRIISQIRSGELGTTDRLQILNDQIILANAGIIPNSELVELIEVYKNEDSEPVWEIVSMALGELKKFVEGNVSAESNLRKLAATIANRQYDRLGWQIKPNEPESDTKLRNTIISLMLYSEEPDVIKKAIDIYESSKLDELNPDLRGLIISAAVKYGDEKISDVLLAEYGSNNSSEIKRDICYGLTSTKSKKTTATLLKTLKDTTTIKTQDTAIWIIYLVRNKYSKEETWKWVRKNWKWLELTFSGDKSYDDFPRYIASALSKKKQLDEYDEFFTPLKSDPSLTRVIDMGINEIKNRIALIERDGQSVKQALDNLEP